MGHDFGGPFGKSFETQDVEVEQPSGLESLADEGDEGKLEVSPFVTLRFLQVEGLVALSAAPEAGGEFSAGFGSGLEASRSPFIAA